MATIVKFKALSGAWDEGPLCYLLEVDDYRILLDCGWTEAFDVGMLELLTGEVKRIDCVLLSHPDLAHLGALPYLYGKLGLRCPMYATTATAQMGQMFLYDAYQSRCAQEDFDTFSIDDVDDAFNAVTTIKFSQTIHLTGKGKGITLAPLSAGHLIGGSVWKIEKDPEKILYACDYNHRKERHLDGTVLESVTNPTLIITDALNADYKQAKRKDRDSVLIEKILGAMRDNGNVLVASDTCGRVLELLQLLDAVWSNSKSGLSVYPIYFLNFSSFNTLNFVRTLMDFMAERLMKEFEAHRTIPFSLRHVRTINTLEEVYKEKGPKVVLTSLSGFSCGFGLELFLQWAGDRRNLVIFTERPPVGTLGRTLVDDPRQTIEVEHKQRVALQGAELEAHLAEKERQAQEAAEELEQQRLLDAQDEQMSESEDEDGGEAALLKHDIMGEEQGGKRRSFFKQTKTHPMFPCLDEKLRWDDYGEIINPQDYIIAEYPTPELAQPQEAAPAQDAAPQAPEIQETPTKCIVTRRKVEVLCKRLYIDFEGRADGESVMRILSHVKPKQMIVVHGSEAATDKLVSDCAASPDFELLNLFGDPVNVELNVSSEQKIYQVKLRDALVSSLKFIDLDEHSLAWVDGLITFDDASMDTDKQMPILTAAETATGHGSTFVGELRPLDFKEVLKANGIQAEFSQGVLVCNDVIGVRRDIETGKLRLEGSLCPTYFAVRDLLYQQYAIV